MPQEYSHCSRYSPEKPRLTAVTVADTQPVIVADMMKQYRQCCNNLRFKKLSLLCFVLSWGIRGMLMSVLGIGAGTLAVIKLSGVAL